MYYLYILLNEAENRTYAGVADDVEKRLSEHNAGRVKSSSPYRPYKVIHTESFETLSEARQKEKFYKSTTGRRRLKDMLIKKNTGIPVIVFLAAFFICSALGISWAKDIVQVNSDNVGVFGLENNQQAQDLGVGWTRLPLWWGNYESDMARMERQLDNLKGVKILITIRAVNPQKTKRPVWVERLINKRPYLANRMSCPPRDIEEYKSFIRQVVRKYKDRVSAWQIENEIYATIKYWVEEERGSIKEFIPMLKAASEVIRQEDPGKPILAPGIALGGVEFDADGKAHLTKAKVRLKLQKEMFDACDKNVRLLFSQACNYFDVIDIHLYHTVESIPGRVSWLKRIMSQANCSKPIWSTEIAGPQLQNRADADDKFLQDQAKELPVRLKTAMNNGIEKVFYFHYKDGNPQNPSDIMIYTLGLVDYKGKKKPAYKAMQEFMAASEIKSEKDRGDVK